MNQRAGVPVPRGYWFSVKEVALCPRSPGRGPPQQVLLTHGSSRTGPSRSPGRLRPSRPVRRWGSRRAAWLAEPYASTSWGEQVNPAPRPARLPATWPWWVLAVVLGLVFTGGILGAARGGGLSGLGLLGVAFAGAVVRLWQVRAKRGRLARATFAGPGGQMRMLPGREQPVSPMAGLVFDQPHCGVGQTSSGGICRRGYRSPISPCGSPATASWW